MFADDILNHDTTGLHLFYTLIQHQTTKLKTSSIYLNIKLFSINANTFNSLQLGSL